MFDVARKHVQNLRIVAVIAGFIGPALLLLLPFHHLIWMIAVLLHLIGIAVSRWLFFAQAQHVVGLYYGRTN